MTMLYANPHYDKVKRDCNVVKSDIKEEWTHQNSVGFEFLKWDHQVDKFDVVINK